MKLTKSFNTGNFDLVVVFVFLFIGLYVSYLKFVFLYILFIRTLIYFDVPLFCCDNKRNKFLFKMHYHIILVKTHK